MFAQTILLKFLLSRVEEEHCDANILQSMQDRHGHPECYGKGKGGPYFLGVRPGPVSKRRRTQRLRAMQRSVDSDSENDMPLVFTGPEVFANVFQHWRHSV